MYLQASLIGGWEKFEPWDHTYLALLGLLFLVCILEVILLKMTTSAGLFTRPQHYDSDYDEAGEYEEDIYYEDLTSNYDQVARRQMRYRQRQQDQERHNMMLQQQYQSQHSSYDHDFNNYHHHHHHHHQHSNTTDVFRFVY